MTTINESVVWEEPPAETRGRPSRPEWQALIAEPGRWAKWPVSSLTDRACANAAQRFAPGLGHFELTRRDVNRPTNATYVRWVGERVVREDAPPCAVEWAEPPAAIVHGEHHALWLQMIANPNAWMRWPTASAQALVRGATRRFRQLGENGHFEAVRRTIDGAPVYFTRWVSDESEPAAVEN